MKVKLIRFSDNKMPERAHYNDAGLDCFAAEEVTLQIGERAKVKLGFGLELPDGYVGLLLPRSSLNALGIRVEVGTIDAGYRGEIQAVLVNNSKVAFKTNINAKIAQLVVLPIAYVDLVDDLSNDRGQKGFGSTGK